jgi:hypothetical protein
MVTKTSVGHELATLQSWAVEAEAAAGIARSLAPTAFIPDTLRRWLPASGNQPRQLDFESTVATVTAALLTGQELGFRPMASLRVIDVIRQTPALRAVGLRALLLSHGHQIVVTETTETRARVRGCRAGSTEWQESTWTIDRAKKLGVFPGPPDGQWRRQPQAMLVARATAEVARWIAADAMLGLPMIAEEVDGDLGELGAAPAMLEPGAPEAPKPATARRRTAAPRAALPAGPPAPATVVPGGPPYDAPDWSSTLPADGGPIDQWAADHPPAEAEADSGPPRAAEALFRPPAEAAPPSHGSSPAAADTLEPGEPIAPALEPITKPQLARLHVLLRECNLTDRNEALAVMSAWLGRDIGSTRELMVGEASNVIDRLTALAKEERGNSNANE